MRKLFSLFLALLPIAAGANTVTDGTFSYEEDAQGGLIITGLAVDVAPLSGDVVLPAETEIDGTARAITGMSCSFADILDKSALTGLDIRTPITEIPAYSFRSCKTLQSIKFPDTLQSIGVLAFESCTGLIGNLILPNSVTTIDQYAFCNCSGFTGDLTIPNSVTTIEGSAFEGCSGFTGNLIIPNSVTAIGSGAFEGCSGFTGNLIIPNLVTTIGYVAFSGCSGFTGSLTIPNSVKNIGHDAFENCSGFTGSLIIPNSVTTIGYQAFKDCTGFNGILTISNSVTTIDNGTFSGCSGFTGELIIPSSVTTIGGSAFNGCSGFTGDLTIGEAVTTIGNYAFYGCSGFTGELVIPNSVTTIGRGAFQVCSGFTGNLTIPNSVTTIGDSAFNECSGFTGNLTIGKAVTTIGNYAFNGCNGFRGDLTIPNSVTAIGIQAFDRCSGFTGDLTIGEAVTTIGNYAFYGCSGFTGSLIIPNSVTTIGSAAFSYCNGFTGDITIPKSVLEIGARAFHISNRHNYRLNSDIPPIINPYTTEIWNGSTGEFDLITYKQPFNIDQADIGVPTGCAEAYRSNEDWAVYENLYEFGDANIDKRLTIADAVAVANNIIGAENSSFNEFIADINFDETITVNDAVRIVDAVLTYAPEEAAHAAARAPRLAGGMLTADDFRLGSDGKAAVGVRLSAGPAAVAMQCDFVADGGIAIDGIVPDAQLVKTHSVKMQQLGDGRMRVVIFSLTNRAIATEGRPLFILQLHGDSRYASGSLHGERVLVSLPDATDSELSFDGGNNLLETGLMDAMQSGPKAVGADGTLTILHAEGMQVEIYSADGRLLDAFTAASEVETRRLGTGIYIVRIANIATKIIL